MHRANELRYIIIISVFSFLIFIRFTKQITLKPTLAQKLKLIIKFSTMKGQMFYFGPTWGIKDEERMEKLV